MKTLDIAAALLATVFGTGTAFAQSQMPMDDQPMTINGVETVCTGAGIDARMEPRWNAYPFHLEVTGRGGQYLGDEHVTVTGQGHSVSVTCGGPWVLMQLPRGVYRVSLNVPEAGQKEITAHVPGRTIANFPNAGGEQMPSGRIASR